MNRSSRARVLELIDAAFDDADARCTMTLRQGEALDDYEPPQPEPLPRDWRDVSDADLETNLYGIPYLDEASRRFYLPAFIAYCVRRTGRPNMTTYHCLHSFLVRAPPLTPAQDEAVAAALQLLAFDDAWDVRDADALAVLERWEKR